MNCSEKTENSTNSMCQARFGRLHETFKVWKRDQPKLNHPNLINWIHSYSLQSLYCVASPQTPGDCINLVFVNRRKVYEVFSQTDQFVPFVPWSTILSNCFKFNAT